MNWKILYIVSFLLIIPLLAKWYSDSNDFGKALIYSRDSKITELKHTDELLGTEVTETQEEKGFWLGLLPGTDMITPEAMAAVLPIGSLLITVGTVGLIMHGRKKRKFAVKTN